MHDLRECETRLEEAKKMIDCYQKRIQALQDTEAKSFFHNICYFLVEKRATRDIGHHGVNLVMQIAYRLERENSISIDLWNDVVMEFANVHTQNALRATREKCMDEGWLVYTNRGNRRPGTYSVQIPQH